MDGQTVLREVASALEAVDPRDGFSPFCRLLVRFIKRALRESA